MLVCARVRFEWGGNIGEWWLVSFVLGEWLNWDISDWLVCARGMGERLNGDRSDWSFVLGKWLICARVRLNWDSND